MTEYVFCIYEKHWNALLFAQNNVFCDHVSYVVDVLFLFVRNMFDCNIGLNMNTMFFFII